MEILTVVAIIGGVSLCLLGHQLVRQAAGSSDPEQSQTSHLERTQFSGVKETEANR